MHGMVRVMKVAPPDRMQLYIGNKNYSSWSLRAWLVLEQSGLPFEAVKLSLADIGTENSTFKREILRINPAGRVPVLADGDLIVWDTLAIAEYVAESAPTPLWPANRAARARARSLCAEMHSGFTTVRSRFPMNIELHAPHVGPRILAEDPEARVEVTRLDDLLADALARSGGPMLFGDFSIADAFYAPIATRMRSYGLPISARTAAYVERIYQWPAMQAWVAESLEEREFVAREELYREQR
jgi:glutathione S-transferase